jgi:hypothetical protein
MQYQTAVFHLRGIYSLLWENIYVTLRGLHDKALDWVTLCDWLTVIQQFSV